MSHNCILLKNFECRQLWRGRSSQQKLGKMGKFRHFLLGDVEKCELTTNHVMMVSKSMKANASFYRAKLWYHIPFCFYCNSKLWLQALKHPFFIAHFVQLIIWWWCWPADFKQWEHSKWSLYSNYQNVLESFAGWDCANSPESDPTSLR